MHNNSHASPVSYSADELKRMRAELVIAALPVALDTFQMRDGFKGAPSALTLAKEAVTIADMIMAQMLRGVST